MSEYKRFVSYIYAYDKGTKSKNVGFAKVESRNGQCRLFINLKGAYAGSGKEQQVYLFHRNGEQLLGTYIGSFSIKNGVGEFRDVSDSANIKNSGYNLNQMGGIFIRNPEQSSQVYASGWDDHGLLVEKFILEDKINTEKKPQNSSENQNSIPSIIKFPEKERTPSILEAVELKEKDVIIQDLELQAPIVQKKEDIKENKIFKLPEENVKVQNNISENIQQVEQEAIDRKARKREIIDQEIKRNLGEINKIEMPDLYEIDKIEMPQNLKTQKTQEAQPLKSEETKTEKMPENLIEEAEKQKEIEVKEKELKTKMQEERGERLWERLMNQFPKVIAFEEEPDIMCLKIDLKDLENLPKENWILGNNSFLLHGYYNFRYLLLARLKENEYILGIPGMYHNKERFMAAMFGFEAFKTVIPCKQKTGQFGYWYQRVRL